MFSPGDSSTFFDGTFSLFDCLAFWKIQDFSLVIFNI